MRNDLMDAKAAEELLRVCRLILTVAEPAPDGMVQFQAAWLEDVRAAVEAAK